MMRETKLTSFVKESCANFGRHYRLCINDEPCKVFDGERCGYFEKFVLGPPDYKYRLPGWDYAKLFAQYAQVTGAKVGKVKQRHCECGTPLKPRQRHCETCAKRRAKQANRQRQRKFQFQNSLT